ncbi:flagellar biosynthetic protein FliO [Paenibacillus sp. IB182496]|uniref:Flagellar biosynthetic protein FliO n=1 Tax=Paenibacillus sabuli TaxID=2772509 RepID=A0A927BR88_9BACL|nr:flagellar biosynthetic protein FliO [Paenibacillus sabuli]MBD2845276.1 flagellar biosynthetic protein FliO [Paenibacillus sabuli]
MLLSGLALAGVARASTGDESGLAGNSQTPAELIPDDNFIGSVVWVIVALAIVIVLIIALIKFLAQRSRMFGLNRSIRTLGGVGVGPNKSLQAVEMGGRIYIVGVGENVTLIDQIRDEQEVQAMIAALEIQSGRSGPGLLDRFKRRKTEDPGTEPWQSSSTSFESLLQDKLDRQARSKREIEAALRESKQTDVDE